MRKEWGLVGEVLPESMKSVWRGELCTHQLEKSSQISNRNKETGTNHIYLCQETLTEGRNKGWYAESKGCLGGLSIAAKIFRFVTQKPYSGSWIVCVVMESED